MRQVSCSTGNCMELGLLVNTRTKVCLVQTETLSTVYLMICATYETGILFFRKLHGTESLSKFWFLNFSCST
jgi:hypothetical protein